jgi:hypothetical protein
MTRHSRWWFYRRSWLVAPLLTLGAAPSRAAEPAVVINEIHAVGVDWIELFNPGQLPADLSEWRLADTAADGSPRLAAALRFPRGTALPPNGYLLAVTERGNKKRKKDQPQVERLCASKGAVRCFRMSWGISKKRGDTLRLVAPDGSVSSEASYPGEKVSKDQTWARQPDGSGPFATSDPTPGQPNTRGRK